jgi:hypothetical protein
MARRLREALQNISQLALELKKGLGALLEEKALENVREQTKTVNAS